MRDKIAKRWIKGTAAAVLLLIMAVAGWLTGPIYYLNDDVTIRYILSGACTGMPDSHGVQMKYPLTWVLAALYRITGGLQVFVPWFDLFMAGCVLLAGTGILAGMMQAVRGKKGFARIAPALIGAVLFTGLLLPHYLYMHYTIIAAMLAGSGLFLWGRRQGRGLPLVMLVLCYLVRSEVFFLSVPFLLVAVLDESLGEVERAARGRQLLDRVCCALKRQGRPLLILLCAVLVCWGIDRVGYGGSEWQEFWRYFDNRVKLYDYTDFPSTDRYENRYEELGLDWGQYQVLIHYDTILDQGIDAEVLERVQESIQGMKEPVAMGERIRQYLRSYYLHMRYDGVPYGLVWAGCLGLLLILQVIHRRWDRLILSAALLAGRSLIWLYLIHRDRFPERIWISLYLIEIGLLAGMLLGEWLENPASPEGSALAGKTWRRGAAAVCMALCLLLSGGAAFMQLRQTLGNMRIGQERQRQWDRLTEQIAGSGAELYLMDVYSAVAYAGEVYGRDCGQILLLGGWLGQCPLVEQRLALYGAEDGAGALLHPEVRLLALADRDISWLEEYLSQRLGPVELKRQEIISCGDQVEFAVYRLVKPHSPAGGSS